MRRRPSAEDRNIADIIRRMPAGSRYDVVVDPLETVMQFMARAKLKTEGASLITLNDKAVTITPRKPNTGC